MEKELMSREDTWLPQPQPAPAPQPKKALKQSKQTSFSKRSLYLSLPFHRPDQALGAFCPTLTETRMRCAVISHLLVPRAVDVTSKEGGGPYIWAPNQRPHGGPYIWGGLVFFPIGAKVKGKEEKQGWSISQAVGEGG